MTSFTITRLVKNHLKARNKADHSILATISLFGGLLFGGYLISHHGPVAGFLTGGSIVGLSFIFGRPMGTFMEEFVEELVPDEILGKIASSKSIPEMLKQEVEGRAPEGLLVKQLLEIERDYLNRMTVVAGPGYQALKRR